MEKSTKTRLTKSKSTTLLPNISRGQARNSQVKSASTTQLPAIVSPSESCSTPLAVQLQRQQQVYPDNSKVILPTESELAEVVGEWAYGDELIYSIKTRGSTLKMTQRLRSGWYSAVLKKTGEFFEGPAFKDGSSEFHSLVRLKRDVDGGVLTNTRMQFQGNWGSDIIAHKANVHENVKKAVTATSSYKSRLNQIRALLGFMEIENIYQFEELPEQRKNQIRRNVSLPRHLIQSRGLYEAEVVLGGKSAHVTMSSFALSQATQQNDLEQMKFYSEHANTLQCDEHGNVPLHYCRSVGAADILLKDSMAAKNARNKDALTPVQKYILDHTKSDKVPDLDIIKYLLPDAHILLQPDSTGICSAMRLEGEARAWFDTQYPPWDTFSRLLSLPAASMLSSLEELMPLGSWGLAMNLHCFGERAIFQRGRHTTRSETRLLEVWACMSRLLNEIGQRDDSAQVAQQALRQLINATQGPCHASLDPREPYREFFTASMHKIDISLGAKLQSEYASMAGPDADWMRGLPSGLSRNLQFGEEIKQIIGPKASMNFSHANPDMVGILTPDWVLANPERDHIKLMKELVALGALESESSAVAKDAHQTSHVYNLLACAGLGNDFDELHTRGAGFAIGDVTMDQLTEYVIVARWHALWLRGLCQQLQHTIRPELCNALRNDQRVKITMRPEALSTKRMLEKLNECIVEMWVTLGQKGAPASVVRHATLQAANSIVDINGCMLVLESTGDMHWLNDRIVDCHLDSSLCLLQTKNGYGSDKKPKLPYYRDLKLLVACKVPRLPQMQSNAPEDVKQMLAVQIQISLKTFYEHQQWTRLPYEYKRGSFDWPHLKDCVKVEETTLEDLKFFYFLPKTLGHQKFLVPLGDGRYQVGLLDRSYGLDRIAYRKSKNMKDEVFPTELPPVKVGSVVEGLDVGGWVEVDVTQQKREIQQAAEEFQRQKTAVNRMMNDLDGRGYNPLHRAALKGDMEELRVIFDSITAPKLRTQLITSAAKGGVGRKAGSTAMHIAAENMHEEAATLLFETAMQASKDCVKETQ